MSKLFYNNRLIEIMKINSVDHQFIFTEDGTDYEGQKVTFDVTGVLTFVSSGQTMADGFSGPLGPGFLQETSPTRIMAGIRQDLALPRKQFAFYTGFSPFNINFNIPYNRGLSESYIQVWNPPDIDNGPKPEHISITRIDGNEAFLVNYVITVATKECPTGSGSGGAGTGGVVSHRWSETSTLNDEGYDVWIREGVIKLRSDIMTMANDPTSLPLLRGLVCIPVAPGFRRTSSKYTVQKDGLAVKYEFRDEEVYMEPPWDVGATKATGTYVQASIGKDAAGPLMDARVNVSLTGQKQAFKKDLIKRALTICINKVGGRLKTSKDDKNAPLPVVKGCTISEEMYENKVQCQMRFLLPAPSAVVGAENAQKPQGVAMAAVAGLINFGGTPSGSEGNIPFPFDQLSIGALPLVATALGDPCQIPASSFQVNYRSAGSSNPDLPSGPSGPSLFSPITPPPAQVSLANIIPPLVPSIMSNAGAGGAGGIAWTIFKAIIGYEFDFGTKQVPVGGTPQQQQQQSLGSPQTSTGTPFPASGSAVPAHPSLATAGKSAVVQMHNPMAMKEITWTAETMIETPLVPDYKPPPGDNLVLNYVKLDIGEMRVSPSGQEVACELSGCYSYFIIDPAKETMEAAVPPWLDRSIAVTELPVIAQFVTNIVNNDNGVQFPSGDPTQGNPGGNNPGGNA